MDRITAPHAAGCVVFTSVAAQECVLLILDQYGKWTFPKGHLEAGESAASAALREVFEETGIRGTLGAHVATIFYDVINKKGFPVRKQVDFFIMTTDQSTVTLQTEEGIQAHQWLPPQAAAALIGYEQHRDVLTRAVQLRVQAPAAHDATTT
jgi:8-oxo-dGTP pyrophosphatase MutT (NUDIX family)